MESIASNLVVDVEQYQFCAQSIRTTCSLYNEALAEYISQLSNAKAEGLQSGVAAENFVAFVSEAEKLNARIETIGQSISDTILSFLEQIDIADDLLFKNEGNKPLTDQEFQWAYAAVDSTPELTWETLGSWIISLVFDKFVKLIWKAADYQVAVENNNSVLVNRIKEVKKLTGEKLVRIKNDVREADRVYQQRLKTLQSEIIELKKALDIVKTIVCSEGGTISATEVELLREWNRPKELDTSVEVSVSDQDVVDFANNVEGYFDSSTSVIRIICEASIGQLITTDFDNYRATVKSARDFFNQYSNDYVSSRERFDDYKAKFDEMLALYNEYGSKWTEHFEGDKGYIKIFNKIMSKAAKVSKKSDDYIDIWFSMFCDMSESEALFSRFKSICDMSKEGVAKAMERIEELYNGSLDAYIDESFETVSQAIKNKALKEGINAGLKAYKNLWEGNPIGSIFNKFLSSYVDKMFGDAPAVAMYDWVETTQQSFDNAVLKLKQADPQSDTYSQLVEDVKVAFEAAKDARMKFYNTIEKSSQGQALRYYQMSAAGIETMSLDDVEAFKAISPDEYYGTNSNALFYAIDGELYFTEK